ncbi:MAG: HDOD domain-containing protein [Algiphilus sp.]
MVSAEQGNTRMNGVVSQASEGPSDPPAQLRRDVLDFARSVRDAVDEDSLVLPTLPDTALRVNAVVSDPDGAIDDLVRAISSDPAIAIRVVQAANSAYTSGATHIDSVQMAVTRLGMQYTRTLVTRLTLAQLFRARSAPLLRFAHGVWQESLRVAALSQVLARERTELHPEVAMLGGLLHLVGALPVIGMADRRQELDGHHEHIIDVIRILQPEIGHYLLSAWGFSASFCACAWVYKDPWRQHEGATEASDVVIVARKLLSLDFLRALSADAELPAFERLRLPYLATLEDLPEFHRAFAVALDGLMQ